MCTWRRGEIKCLALDGAKQTEGINWWDPIPSLSVAFVRSINLQIEVHQANLTSLDFSMMGYLSYWINSINRKAGNEVIENEQGEECNHFFDRERARPTG